MKIKRVEFKNFKCFPDLILPERETENFSEGLFLIQGTTPERSNSFGKTSFVEGILFGLFGPKSTILSINNLITFGQDKGEIKIIFELDGVDYMIQRLLNRTSSSGSQKLRNYIRVNNTWKADNTIKIEELLEIKREQALQTSFVKQGEIESLASASPAKLRDLIIDLFRLNIVDYASDYLKNINKDAINRIKSINRNYIAPSEIDKDINRKDQQLTGNNIEIKNNSKKIDTLKTQLINFPDKEKLTELKDIKQKIEQFLGKIEVFLEQLANKLKTLSSDDSIQESNIDHFIKIKENEITKLESNKDTLSEALKKVLSEINKKEGIISQIEKNKGKINKNFDFKGGKRIAKCPTCTREISYQDAQEILNHYDNEINALKNDVNKLKPDLEELENNKQDIENKLDELNSIFRNLQDIKEIYTKKKKFEIEIENKRLINSNLLRKFDVSTEKEFLEKFNVKNLDQLREKIIKIDSEINSLVNVNKRIESENNYLKNEIQELKLKKKNMIKLRDEREQLEMKIKHVDKNKELVKGFITEYMVEKRLIHNIQYETKRFLKYFSGGQYSNLDLKSVDKGRGIKIAIFDDFSKTMKDIDFLSGGDKVALGFALRMGISELMTKIRPTKNSPKKNPKIDFMILDEPLAALDKDRRKQVLTTLESQKDFNQIFLITHTDIPEEIKPNFIKIKKNFENGLSSAVYIDKEKNQ